MGSSFPRRSSDPRRRAVRAVTLDAIALVSVLAVLSATACRPAHGSAGGLALWLEVRSVAVAPARAAREDGASGVGLALNAMSDAERSRMAETLGHLADRLEREHNPLVDDLDDESDVHSEVAGLARERLPMLTAAAALAQGQWASADRRLTVRATTGCAPDARCIPLGVHADSSDDRVATRARFLAWPVAYGVVLRPPSDRARAVVEALRTRADGSRIALVLGEEDLHALRFSAALPELADGIARIDRWAPEGAPMKELFRRLSARDATSDDLRWLTLPSGALLVVPRLGALASVDAFVNEVRVRVGAVTAQVEWLALPPG
ncbi:MAG TPA: hypothetical protein VF765_08830 [Polyangiaceae bacterium]